MNTRKQSIILWSVVLSVLSISAIGIFVRVGVVSTASSGPEVRLAVPVSASDHTTSNQQGAVTVVVYSDLQCPSCAAFNDEVKDLEKTLAPNVRFIYRHFPLPQHTNSPQAAFAAEAAGMQGKFFQMRDRLFATQDDWSKLAQPADFFKKVASDLGLDAERFASDMESKQVMEKVMDDYNSAVAANIESTPSVFVEGKLSSEATSVQTLRKQIDETLKTR